MGSINEWPHTVVAENDRALADMMFENMLLIVRLDLQAFTSTFLMTCMHLMASAHRKNCLGCGKEHPRYTCACRRITLCSKECQMKTWAEHKLGCNIDERKFKRFKCMKRSAIANFCERKIARCMQPTRCLTTWSCSCASSSRPPHQTF